MANDEQTLIALRLKKSLKEKEVSVKELSESLSVQRTHIYKILNGERGLTIPVLLKLHRKYDLDLLYILLNQDKNSLDKKGQKNLMARLDFLEKTVEELLKKNQ